ncbi:MAG TPA: NADH-quinone oxidoreductase subunit L [Rhodanobacteraceae bacterium]
MHQLSTTLLLVLVLAPLVGAVLAGFLRNIIGRAGAGGVAIVSVGLSCALSFYVLYQLVWGGAQPYDHNIYTWFQVGHINASFGMMIDRLSAMMMAVVTFVSLMVHIYTIGYMADDDGFQRFFSYIALFTFSMLILVVANNFMQLFVGWELVGLVSYLLIGFWYKKPSATFASLKAFIVNRVGDFGFVLGIAAVLYFLHTLDYQTAFDNAPSLVGKTLALTSGTHWDAATVICILLFIGATGKSAQVPLHVWLPDSMEGPTPISALIHAATMVTAGIFMVARMSPIFELSQAALSYIMIIGATGALFMGLVGIVQNDIKRVIAYSTLSQLGYMTVALGVSIYAGAVFHLMTHAFFKALLFLCSGSVIIAMHHDQDMRNMGGLRKYMPITWLTMWAGSIALMAVPFTSGFYSKDAIIDATGLSHRFGAGYAYFCVLAGAFVTACYTLRQMYMTFHGKERFEVVHDHGDGHHELKPGQLHHAPKESPLVVTIPLILLAIPSLIIGFLTIKPMLYGGWFGKAIHEGPAGQAIIDHMHEEFHGPLSMAIHGIISWPFGLVVLAFIICTYIYLFNPAMADRIRRIFNPVYVVLDRKFWFDTVYIGLFAKGGLKFGRMLWKGGDKAILDGVFVDGGSNTIERLSAGVRRMQSGLLYHYAFAMIVGLILLLGGFWWFGGV